ncbi:MAG: DUF1834 family protein [Methylotenera sp.]|nr:DUF1834 family protein [Methylotenera sp.]
MLTEVENALVAEINKSPIAKKLKQIGTLPDLDGDSLVSKFATDAPAVYVAPAASFAIKDSIVNVGFGIACVARNAGGQAATRKGDGKMIGMYQIAETVAALLDGYKAGGVTLYASSISIMNDEKIYKAGLQVAVITLQGQATLPPSIDPAGLDDFITFNAQYDIEPHASAAEHTKWSQEPPDHSTSKPDLTDNITLQE